MKHIGASLKRTMDPSKGTERGELMLYFRQKLNIDRNRDGFPLLSMARMGKILEKIPTKDLYYLKRICDDSKSFSKKFWWELNPNNFENGVPKQPVVKKKTWYKPKKGGIKPQDFRW